MRSPYQKKDPFTQGTSVAALVKALTGIDTTNETNEALRKLEAHLESLGVDTTKIATSLRYNTAVVETDTVTAATIAEVRPEVDSYIADVLPGKTLHVRTAPLPR